MLSGKLPTGAVQPDQPVTVPPPEAPRRRTRLDARTATGGESRAADLEAEVQRLRADVARLEREKQEIRDRYERVLDGCQPATRRPDAQRDSVRLRVLRLLGLR